MKATLKNQLFGMIWLTACLLPLAACADKKAAAEPLAAAVPEVEQKVDVPAYAIITSPTGSDPSVLQPALSQAKGAQVVVLEKLPKQISDTGIKSPFFSGLAVVRFADESEFDAWYAPASQTLGDVATIKRADLIASDGLSDAPRPDAYFAVNLYETLVPPDAYKTYTDTYIVPNMANQKKSGVMTSYAMYLERDDGKGKPRSILVKEYASEDAFGKSDAVKETYKAEVLLKDAEWKRIDETKATIRTDLNETLAKNSGG